VEILAVQDLKEGSPCVFGETLIFIEGSSDESLGSFESASLETESVSAFIIPIRFGDNATICAYPEGSFISFLGTSQSDCVHTGKHFVHLVKI
jgi:hypothetical protein